MMWALIFLFILVLSLAGFVFVVSRLTEFAFLRRLPRRRAYLLSTLLFGLLLAAVSLWSGIWNGMIVFIHLLLFWLLCDGCFKLAEKLRGRPFARYWAGAAAIGLTVCCLAVGYYSAHHVCRTAYSFDAGKDLGISSLRIVGFSDSHVGTTFSGEELQKHVDAMNAEHPDIAVVVGDFADDETSYADMEKACRALGQLKAKYGVYYVFGNHDSGYYSNRRGYGKEELVQNLQKNGVTVLEDEVVPVAGNVVLCGRQDAGQPGRMSMEELVGRIPADSFSVVLDHQPNDYAAEAAAGAGLVVSGHTHGGQFFPINRAGEWIGANDMTYGTDLRDSTRFVITSGIGDWAFRFRTGCISEYFVIDLMSY